jgi:hypothetical protein
MQSKRTLCDTASSTKVCSVEARAFSMTRDNVSLTADGASDNCLARTGRAGIPIALSA